MQYEIFYIIAYHDYDMQYEIFYILPITIIAHNLSQYDNYRNT